MSRFDVLADWLKSTLDYMRVYGVGAGLQARARIAGATLTRQDTVSLGVPRSSRTVRLRVTDRSDQRVFTDVFVNRCYDLDRHVQSQRALAATGDMLIIDCGANNGCSAVWFSERYPEAHIVAIEPEPGNFALLSQNVASCPNIEPICAAIWDCETELDIVGSGSAWAYQTRPATDESGSRRTPTVTLDNVLARYPNARRVILKIDVEGAEGTIFR